MESACGRKGAQIKAIDGKTSHKICSGQVILSLATAVKELLENSLDAGATTVDVRLKEHGSELVEVSDNGSGIGEADFEGIALKHHTSKLQYFADLTSIETFGFRGEALSSLSALADVTVTTRHRDAPRATRLEFDRQGRLTKRTPCARQVGTTVTVQQLFTSLPVRHKEFLGNIKRDFSRMIQVVTAYCLVSSGIRITCSNQVGRGQKTTIVTNQGQKTARENISTVFGSKQMEGLLEVKQTAPSAELTEEMGIDAAAAKHSDFTLEGFVSSCASGGGRSSTDRQFYYINGRPCDPHRVAKMVNQVYHTFNRHQYPFVFLHVRTSTGEDVDVNVTPDKRQIMVVDEKLLLATVKASLLKTFEGIASTYDVQNIKKPAILAEKGGSSREESERSFSLPRFSQRLGGKPDAWVERVVIGAKRGAGMKQSSVKLFLSDLDEGSPSKRLCTTPRKDDSQSSGYSSGSLEETADKDENVTEVESRGGDGMDDARKEDVNQPVVEEEAWVVRETGESMRSESFLVDKDDHLKAGSLGNDTAELHPETELESLPQVAILTEATSRHRAKKTKVDSTSKSKKESRAVKVDEKPDFSHRRHVDVRFSLSSVRQRLESLESTRDCKDVGSVTRRFRAGIDPQENNSAEEELRREISKPMFSQMEVLGQFNLGFIVTRLGPDLFIIDQHASDEKYNFENLQASNALKNQRLLSPQQLELTVANEMVLLDNLQIFRRNGFEFAVDESGTAGRRVSLASVPVSQNWTFGKEDIDELIFMLQDAPGTSCRPSRVRAMFASRACRMSIMIGRALSQAEMQRLVDHMGEMDQPWNCPHGRPTMRHLLNLNLVM